MQTVLHRDGFKLEIGNTGYDADGVYTGSDRLPYRLFDETWHDDSGADSPIFEGCDFCPSPCHSEDGPEAIAALLSFLSLRPGDTDSEYFDNYTDRQIAWRDARAESLSMIASDLETAASWQSHCQSHEHMQPWIDFGAVCIVETTCGTEVIADSAVDPACLEGDQIGEIETVETWYGRMTAPGYMDCTPWETAETAADLLLDLFYDYGDDFGD